MFSSLQLLCLKLKKMQVLQTTHQILPYPNFVHYLQKVLGILKFLRNIFIIVTTASPNYVYRRNTATRLNYYSIRNTNILLYYATCFGVIFQFAENLKCFVSSVSVASPPFVNKLKALESWKHRLYDPTSKIIVLRCYNIREVTCI